MREQFSINPENRKELTPLQKELSAVYDEILHEQTSFSLSRLRFTYEQRKEFSWLGENGGKFLGRKVNGLAYALGEGMRCSWMSPNSQKSENEIAVDETFLQELAIAKDTLFTDPAFEDVFRSFERMSKHYRLDSTKVKKKRLLPTIVNGFETYCRNTYALGWSGDPW